MKVAYEIPKLNTGPYVVDYDKDGWHYSIAKECASDFYNEHDGREDKWPIVFRITADDRTWEVEINMEEQPVFLPGAITTPLPKGEIMKIVINSCYGGFGLSHAAVLRYWELQGKEIHWYIDDIGKKVYGQDIKPGDAHGCIHYCFDPNNQNETYWSYYDMKRDDPLLIQVVKELKNLANGRCAELEIVEIPDGVKWEIDEYDGIEHVAEQHRTWG